MTRTKLRFALPALALLGVTGYAFAEDGVATLEALAKALVTKRSSVERLSAKLDLAKAQQRDELRRQNQQEADLARQIKALEQELTEVRAARAAQEAALAKKSAARAKLAPLVGARLEALLSWVRGGIPFKRPERVADLERLAGRVEEGAIKPDEALGRLWSALEDELRLTRENGLYRQRIQLDGDAQLADVAKVGMVLMYFRTLDGRVGLVAPGERDWRYRVTRDPAQRRQIQALFEALEKHVRSGYFELPNPYAVAQEKSS